QATRGSASPAPYSRGLVFPTRLCKFCYHHYQTYFSSTMSSSTSGQTSTPSSDFKSIINTGLSRALNEYKNKTGKPLLDHPLAAELQRCDSVDAIKAILQVQAEAFQQFRDGDKRLMRWINPVVDVLSTFSDTIGGAASIGFPPAGPIFSAIGVLLAAGKGVRASHDALVELLEPMKDFFERLGVYTQIPLTAEMAEVLVKIVAEIFSILSIATKEVTRKRAKIYLRSLLGRTDIEDSLKKLNGLIQKEVPMAIAQTMMDVNEIKWNQIEQDVRKWFSPPDPSTNHNTACGVYHNAPPTWFFEASVFKGWMSNGSLLWVHGKPGSGKSVLCAAIIQHIMTLRDSGSVTLTYFYFDFRDEEKQNVRNAVASLLIQLSAYSKHCCEIIHQLYSTHGKGTQQPSNGILIDRLKEMLTVTARQQPIFIVLDALDECPDDGTPTPREEVLNLVVLLVRLQLPNLHICVTSRPEIDIQTMLKPLAVNAISLHDETKQKFVIANYVSSVVSSDVRMKKWRDEDKKLVVEELSERADGMFQWVFCQLDMLRHTVQPDVRAILAKLPKTLDETYERVLNDINENNREHACRLLHCLAVAVRPLRVEELAEILTFDFDAAQDGIPKFHPDRRPKDPEEAVLSICSSLITIIDNPGSRVVQFSHFSVKEFLTSNHLASSTEQLTPYNTLPGPAHTILAQVCLGLLLHSDDSDDNKSVKDSPLAEYAARNWIAHAQFEDVASHVEDGMVSLFDHDRPHFATWISLYDIDAESGRKLPTKIPNPLYYSALCGFHVLVQHISIKSPQDVNASGDSFGFPVVAALYRNHFPVAEFLLEHGGRVDVRDEGQQTALYKAIDRPGNVALDVVRFLLDHGADVNARRDDHWTPLHLAVNIGELSVARMLLDHQADVNSRN
ncbi:hypothetical protein V8E53_000744, partial [Lactarius tabidus]